MSGIIPVRKAAVIGAVGKLTTVLSNFVFRVPTVNRRNKTKFGNTVLLSERIAADC